MRLDRRHVVAPCSTTTVNITSVIELKAPLFKLQVNYLKTQHRLNTEEYCSSSGLVIAEKHNLLVFSPAGVHWALQSLIKCAISS